MLSVKSILLEQFTACYDENGWFVVLKNAVKNLTAEQTIWKTENLDNSIWEILRRLNFYNEACLKLKAVKIIFVQSLADRQKESHNLTDSTKRLFSYLDR